MELHMQELRLEQRELLKIIGLDLVATPEELELELNKLFLLFGQHTARLLGIMDQLLKIGPHRKHHDFYW